MAPSLRPERDESRLADADLWELKVNQGMPEAEATAYVQARSRVGGAGPAADATAFTHGGGSTWGDVSAPTAAIYGFNRGAGFGFDDELTGLLGALTGKGYAASRDAYRAGRDDAFRQHKKTALGGTAVGAIASPLNKLLAPLAGPKAAGLGGKMLQGARVGAPAGAIAGAGEADGGLVERAKGALVGGGGGTVFGAALPLALRGAGALLIDLPGLRPQAPLSILPSAARSGPALQARPGVVRFGDPKMATDAALFGVNAPSTGAGAAAPSLAAQLVRERMMPGVPLRRTVIAKMPPMHWLSRAEALRARPGAADPEPLARAAASLWNRLGPRPTSEIAQEIVLANLQRAGVAPADALAAARSPTAAPKPETLLELGQRPMQRVAQAARGLSAKAGQTIDEALSGRHAGQSERVLRDVEAGLGAQRSNVFQTVDDIVQRRSAQAAPDYARAFEHAGISLDAKAGQEGTTLAALLKRPSMERALSRAKTIASEEGAPLSDIADVERIVNQLEAMGVPAEKAARAAQQTAKPVPLKALHYVKLALDDMLYGAKRGQSVLGEASGGTGPTALGKIQQTRNALMEILDREAPDYAKARANFAGASALKDALESGIDAIGSRKDPRLIAREFTALTASEKEMYRQGAIDALRKRIEDAPSSADAVKRVFDRTADKDRLRALFDSGAQFAAFRRQVEREAQMHQAQTFITGGSNTADKFAAQQDLSDEALALLAKTARRPLTGLWHAGTDAIARRGRVATQATAEALAPIITAGARNPEDLRRVLTQLIEAQRAAEARALSRARGTAGASSLAGGGASSLLGDLFRPAP